MLSDSVLSPQPHFGSKDTRHCRTLNSSLKLTPFASVINTCMPNLPGTRIMLVVGVVVVVIIILTSDPLVQGLGFCV